MESGHVESGHVESTQVESVPAETDDALFAAPEIDPGPELGPTG
jgi:hypothetical protein